MRMKENHIRNEQLKIATENQFILHYDIYPNPTDTRTLLSFLEIYPHELKRVVADVWYSSEKNLLTLTRMEVEHLIKYNFFDNEQKKRIWIIELTMKEQIPTPSQRVEYASLITSNTAIPRQILSKKSGVIRQNNLN